MPEVAAEITRLLDIPTIGIGSGPDCARQVLVINDLIGLNVRPGSPGQVRRVLYSLGEGAAGCGTEMFSGTSDVLVIAWSNETVEYELDNAADLATCHTRQGLVGPASVTIGNPAGHWHRRWYQAGMTVSDLARLIGRPISVSVCPCDFGGFIDTPGRPFPDRLELWAEFPLNADYTYAANIDTAADYLLSSVDIGTDAESDFPISRMVVGIDH